MNKNFNKETLTCCFCAICERNPQSFTKYLEDGSVLCFQLHCICICECVNRQLICHELAAEVSVGNGLSI
jgi:hypothetical protein